MHIEILVEEPSVEAALQHLIPKICGNDVTHRCIVHQCKHDLLKKLPEKLRAYRKWLPEDYRIVVLIDADREDCVLLKQKLEKIAISAGFTTKTSARSKAQFQVLNRLAVEELEAWFFGDIDALRAAYQGISETLANQRNYRDPDAIAGGTWEALERELKKAGYFREGLQKIKLAREVSRYMEPERNRSKSFQVFRSGLIELGRAG